MSVSLTSFVCLLDYAKNKTSLVEVSSIYQGNPCHVVSGDDLLSIQDCYVKHADIVHRINNNKLGCSVPIISEFIPQYETVVLGIYRKKEKKYKGHNNTNDNNNKTI